MPLGKHTHSVSKDEKIDSERFSRGSVGSITAKGAQVSSSKATGIFMRLKLDIDAQTEIMQKPWTSLTAYSGHSAATGVVWKDTN